MNTKLAVFDFNLTISEGCEGDIYGLKRLLERLDSIPNFTNGDPDTFWKWSIGCDMDRYYEKLVDVINKYSDMAKDTLDQEFSTRETKVVDGKNKTLFEIFLQPLYMLCI